MENENETYLSDWLANKISDNQLKELVSHEDFLAFVQLRKITANQDVEIIDMVKNFEAIKHKIEAKKSKSSTKVVHLWKYISIAACLLVSFGLHQFFYFSNEVATDFGLTKKIELSDNSIVTLNSKSQLKYPNLFQYNRKLKLEGEAFFEVQKGSAFEVETTLGKVKVLGTKFNVISFKDYFEVVCYHGKVQVDANHKTIILTQGESVRFYDNIVENWADKITPIPLWIKGETSFKNVPVKYVIAKLKNQYNVSIECPRNVEKIKFTGSFTNSNIETALKTICIPLKLKYSNTNYNKIILSE